MIRAFRVRVEMLPEALEAMNVSGMDFQAEVIEVITGQQKRGHDCCTVIVNMNYYPYMEEEWKQKGYIVVGDEY